MLTLFYFNEEHEDGQKPAAPVERGEAAEFEAGKHLHFAQRQLKREKQPWIEPIILESGSFRREGAGLFRASPSSSFNAQCALHPLQGERVGKWW